MEGCDWWEYIPMLVHSQATGFPFAANMNFTGPAATPIHGNFGHALELSSGAMSAA